LSRPRRSGPPSDELRARFGANLHDRRKRLGLGISQEELAFRAETHKTAISAQELGQTLPRIDTFIRVAGALGTTPNDLTAGILWVPAEVILASGGFDVPDDKALTAEVAALRRQAR
jgi:transcriptional regulator with XRE-family HTH domain